MASVADLFAHAGDAAFAVDRRQNIVYWNDAAAALLGYGAAEAIGRFCWRMLDGHTPDGRLFCRPECPILQILRHNITTHPFSLIVRRADNNRQRVQVSTIPLADPQDPEEPLLLVHLFREDHPFAHGAELP